MKIVFSRRPKPKQFDYKPIYWDQEKEELEKRRKQLSNIGKEKTGDDIKLDLRADINRTWRRNHKTTDQKAHTIKFIIYLSVILFFVYLIFFTDFINNFLSFFIR